MSPAARRASRACAAAGLTVVTIALANALRAQAHALAERSLPPRRLHRTDRNFIAWQMAVGVLPFVVIPFFYALPATQWSVTYGLLLLHTGAISTALGFLLWIGVLRWLPAGTATINMLAIPVIGLLTSMLFFSERLDALEWTGIACIVAGLAIVSLHAWWTTRAGRAKLAETAAIESSCNV